GDGKVEAEILVRELYNDIKQDLLPKNNENLFSNPSLLDDSDIFKALEDDVPLEEEDDDEIN
ncbi:13889_t:CDS:1, partial [Funneliformis caledonium]